jgi:hypothetical protein
VSLLKLIPSNHFVSLCKELINNEAERSLSPKVCHCWTELDEYSFVWLFLFSLYLLLVVLWFHTCFLYWIYVMLLLFKVTLMLVTTSILLHTSKFIGVRFEFEFTTVTILQFFFSKDGESCTRTVQKVYLSLVLQHIVQENLSS